MGVATLEDLQGSIEVVVFPKMYEQTAATWTEGAILARRRPGRPPRRGRVAAGRPRRRSGTRPSRRGPEAFAREVAAGDRGRAAAPPAGGGRAGSGRPVTATGRRRRTAQRPANGHAGGAGRGGRRRETIPYVSPLRAEFRRRRHRRVPRSAAIATVARPSTAPAADRAADRPRRADPDLPGAAGPRAPRRPTTTSSRRCPTRPATGRPSPRRAPTPPVDAVARRRSSTSRFAAGAGTDRVVGAMEAFKGLLVERPGATRVVLHVPAPSGGASLPMELRRGVAYDAELLAEVRRRLGEGIVELSLS